MAKPKKIAGGWGALSSSLHFLRRESFLKGNATLLRMNQPRGFRPSTVGSPRANRRQRPRRLDLALIVVCSRR